MVRLAGFVVSAFLVGPVITAAQPLGVFRWQLLPYCNVVTLAVTQNGGVYRLGGTDDQCGGGADMASVIGPAFQNPDGTIGFGLNLVSSPGGAPVHVNAEISLATLSGTWLDSAGNSGAFVFTPAAGTGGTPRPATGTIGALAINPAQVQLRVSGTCSAGLFMQSIAQNGSIGCGLPAGGGTITGVFPSPGLTGGGFSGQVSLGLRTTATGAFDFSNFLGFVATGGSGIADARVSGEGTRLMWYPIKHAFRAGRVTGSHWVRRASVRGVRPSAPPRSRAALTAWQPVLKHTRQASLPPP